MKTIITLFAICTTKLLCAQISPPIVNATAYSSANMEYNTGEIFVVYQFQNATYTKPAPQQDDENSNVVESGVVVYPNPVTSFLYYKKKDSFVFSNVTVFDSNMKILKTQNLDSGEIDFAGFAEGTYTVVFNNENVNSFKILKK
nr:T9SS type A sorting domain-containing protein [uncultured Flavobacterium sp.]